MPTPVCNVPDLIFYGTVLAHLCAKIDSESVQGCRNAIKDSVFQYSENSAELAQVAKAASQLIDALGTVKPESISPAIATAQSSVERAIARFWQIETDKILFAC